MDSVTHLVTGAAIGQAMLGKKAGNKAVLWGAIVGSIPDIDVVFGQFMNTVDELVYHRGFSHSLVFVLLVSPLLGYLLTRIYKKINVTAMQWGLMVFVNLIAHILLDCFTTWGTQVFWPHPYRVEFKNIFVIDPLFTVPLLIAVIWMLFYKKDNPLRQKIIIVGLLVSSTYMLFTIVNKLNMNQTFEQHLALQNIEWVQYATKPSPLNNVLWSVTAETEDGYHIGFHSLFDKRPDTPYFYFEKNHHLLQPYLHDRDLQRLLFMTQGYYTVEETENGVLLNDLRFGQTSGWHTGEGDFVFAYFVDEMPDGSIEIHQRVNTFRDGKEMLPPFWERIKGIE